ncbi:MAG: glycosyltransferase family 2 protein, partial [Polyangiaceae bacterium]|nr:glycosyltransferase family 2 protein [Polyangiaceae bacterium]
GFLACLSGGAKLHSRANMEDLGGKIYSNTLAEDTFTTFYTQMKGRRAIFEPNALVYAEEPNSLDGLWKQRVRWARGNVQITKTFRNTWFKKSENRAIGSLPMGLIWFSIFLMPIFQISASLSLIMLYFVNEDLAWMVFRALWIIAGIVYLVVTFGSFIVDHESIEKSWGQGILFPGIVSLGLITHSLAPGLFPYIVEVLGFHWPQDPPAWGVLFIYSWLSINMAVAYFAYYCEERPKLKRLSPWILHIGGYGAFLCAVTLGSYIKELTGEKMTWDKTEKTGQMS